MKKIGSPGGDIWRENLMRRCILFPFVVIVAAYCTCSGGVLPAQDSITIERLDGSTNQQRKWPVLKHYDQQHLARIALPLGGIGTGTVSLGGRGDLRDWEIMNRPAKAFFPESTRTIGPFFALYVKPAGTKAVTRALEGPLDLSEYEGASGSPAKNHGLPRFRSCSFSAAYPFGQVILSDPDVPVAVRIKAFNPLVPADSAASGIPMAALRYELTNHTSKPVEISICGSVQNFIGMDGWETKRVWGGYSKPVGAKGNRNTFRDRAPIRGIFMDSQGVDANSPAWGTMALTTLSAEGVSYRTSWKPKGWGSSTLDFWDDFSSDGALANPEPTKQDMPMASLAVKSTLAPNATGTVTFLITWHFPNRYGWSPSIVGNYYTTQYTDAWNVVEKVGPRLETLEADTIRFVDSLCRTNLPEVVKEAALFNISTLRSQTCFRTADGYFFGWEGCHDREGCCHGSCAHVWNYEQATAFLFGELACSMREVEFGRATDDKGLVSFRVNLPIENAQGFAKAAADGQLGCIMKMYRDWQLSGDDEMLKTLWPNVR
ncbi:MAG: GH116 family glycosyl-hydrolase, partial [Planctomycetota bacterium]